MDDVVGPIGAISDLNFIASSARLASQECIAVHIKRAGLFLTNGPAECVHRQSNLDVNETADFKHLLPARTGQPTSNSTGPQINVLQRLEWNWETVGNVSKLQRAARLENPMNFREHRLLVGT